MEVEFVSYEQAVALKELGFNEHVWCTYDKKEILNFEDDGPNRNSDIITWVSGDRVCSAPLKQQVFRWFREKYELYYHIFPLQITASDKIGYRYSWEIYNHTPEWIANDEKLLGSLAYEEAENDCIDKLIEIAKQTK